MDDMIWSRTSRGGRLAALAGALAAALVACVANPTPHPEGPDDLAAPGLDAVAPDGDYLVPPHPDEDIVGGVTPDGGGPHDPYDGLDAGADVEQDGDASEAARPDVTDDTHDEDDADEGPRGPEPPDPGGTDEEVTG